MQASSGSCPMALWGLDCPIRGLPWAFPEHQTFLLSLLCFPRLAFACSKAVCQQSVREDGFLLVTEKKSCDKITEAPRAFLSLPPQESSSSRPSRPPKPFLWISS